MSLEEFMKKLLESLLILLPGFDAGSVILEINGKWRYVAWIGYDDILGEIEVDPEKFFVPKTEDPVVISAIHLKDGGKDRETMEKLAKAGAVDIVKTIGVAVFGAERPIGAFFVDSFKDVEITEDMLKTVKAFGKFASLFVSMKIYQERERGYQKGIIQTMVRMMEMRDPYTVGHSERVAKYSVELAKNLKLSPEDVDRIYWGSIVHDIGKMGIPEEILLKPSKLTKEEYELIKKHPVLGEEALSDFQWLSDLKPIVRHHHERWDGTGYPDGLKGEEIPFEARIVSVADAFDSMTSKRAYRNALLLEEALKEIEENSGKQFDPYIAGKALEIFKKIAF